jgi:1-acyl-sn-glycerol-3-phosphate acyltransferase
MIRSIFTILVVAVLTAVLGMSAVITGFFNPYSRMNDFFSRSWANVILWAAGVKIIVKGLENINSNQSYIYMANHQSLFDILAVLKILPAKVRFIAKKELFKIPVFGWALSAVGMIKIDRSNRERAIVSMNHALSTIKGGISIIIFPEGTRSKDGLIHEFKKGGFVIAIKGAIPVIPVTIYGTHNILQKHSLKLKPGSVYMHIDKPIKTDMYNYQTRDGLIEKVHHTIYNTFDRLKNSHR